MESGIWTEQSQTEVTKSMPTPFSTDNSITTSTMKGHCDRDRRRGAETTENHCHYSA
jgi:hypothetical protein